MGIVLKRAFKGPKRLFQWCRYEHQSTDGNFEVILIDTNNNGNADEAEIDEDEDGKTDVIAYDFNEDGEWDKFENI